SWWSPICWTNPLPLSGRDLVIERGFDIRRIDLRRLRRQLGRSRHPAGDLEDRYVTRPHWGLARLHSAEFHRWQLARVLAAFLFKLGMQLVDRLPGRRRGRSKLAHAATAAFRQFQAKAEALLVLVAGRISDVGADRRHHEVGRTTRRKGDPPDLDIFHVEGRHEVAGDIFLTGVPFTVRRARAIAAVEHPRTRVEFNQRGDVPAAADAFSK